MEKLKKVILVLGPLVLIAGLYVTFAGKGSPIPGTVQMVNVLTGELQSVAQSKLGLIPAPDSDGRFVLYPVERKQDGPLVVGERYRSDILQRIKAKDLKRDELKIDLSTFAVGNK